MPHTHAQVDFTVEVFVVHQQKVLLRLHDKYSLWLSVGGHIERNEDPVEAALREVREEVGLNVTLLGMTAGADGVPEHADYQELVPPRFLNRHRISESHEHVTLTYFATAKTDQVRATGTDRSDTWRWLTREQVEAAPDLLPHIKRYALAALDAVGTGQS